MRLVLTDRLPKRKNFYPLTLCHPIWELRSGMTTLGEKLVAPGRAPAMWPASCRPTWPRSTHANCLAGQQHGQPTRRRPAAGGGPREAGRLEGATGAQPVRLTPTARCLRRHSAGRLRPAERAIRIDALLARPSGCCPRPPAPRRPGLVWELVLANAEQLTEDFARAGRSGIEGTVEQPEARRGKPHRPLVAPGAVVHPLVVLDPGRGPIYIDEGAEIHPFTRVEGPCYSAGSDPIGGQVREGNTIGPMCRVGGEVEDRSCTAARTNTTTVLSAAMSADG